jgi:signal transduction histidine kinase
MTASSLRILSSDSKENQRQPNRPPPLESESGIVSSLAHEINNPVEALHQLHYLIETEGTLKEKGRQYLALAREEVRRISQILHAAMEMRDTGDPEDTDLPGLLRSVLDFYKSRLKAQGVSVNTRYRTAAHLSGYPHQLRQMCANLLLNAVDATPSGGKIYARIAPAQAWQGDHKRGLRLTFADTGSGIAAKNLARIYDPFFTTKGSAGNGLGLSLVKTTVQKHHGVLRVRSSTKAGHSGTVFSIFLPCA